MQPDRDAVIRQHLFQSGPLSVAEIASLTDSSVATVRRDLQRLEERGIIERTHGGARIAGGAGREVAFEARERINIAAKRAIGSAAHAMLRPGMSVFLDASTTVLQCARYLRMAPLPLAAFTNSLAVAATLVGAGDVRVTVLGGQLRAENLSAVGPLAEAAIAGLRFDLLLLGASAVQPDGLFTPDSDEASLNGCMIRSAARRCVLADRSKFGQTATYRVAALHEVTDVLTDAPLSHPWPTRLAEAGVELTVAQAVQEPVLG